MTATFFAILDLFLYFLFCSVLFFFLLLVSLFSCSRAFLHLLVLCQRLVCLSSTNTRGYVPSFCVLLFSLATWHTHPLLVHFVLQFPHWLLYFFEEARKLLRSSVLPSIRFFLWVFLDLSNCDCLPISFLLCLSLHYDFLALYFFSAFCFSIFSSLLICFAVGEQIKNKYNTKTDDNCFVVDIPVVVVYTNGTMLFDVMLPHRLSPQVSPVDLFETRHAMTIVTILMHIKRRILFQMFASFSKKISIRMQISYRKPRRNLWHNIRRSPVDCIHHHPLPRLLPRLLFACFLSCLRAILLFEDACLQ